MDLETARDRIYEAALVPERWPAVLDMLADMAGAVGGLLICDDPANPLWANSASLDRFLADFVAGGWGQVDTRMPKLLRANRSGFMLEEDVYAPAELARDPLFEDFLKPRGFGWATATAMPRLDGTNVIVSIERRFADGPVPRSALAALDALRGDLARAVRLSGQAKLTSGRGTIEVMSDLGLAAAVVARTGALMAVNKPFEALIPDVVRDTRERVSFAEPRADNLLAELLRIGTKALPCAIPIRWRAGGLPYVAHFIPVAGTVNDVFSGGLSIMIVKPVALGRGPTAGVLKSLFNLTDAEASVCRQLAAGQSLAVVAEHNGVSVETVRSQLKSLFNKTDVRRQVDLVRLVASINPEG